MWGPETQPHNDGRVLLVSGFIATFFDGKQLALQPKGSR